VQGTRTYMAPEVLDHNYDSKCDMWSVGVIVFILLSGVQPFGDSRTPVNKLEELIQIGKYDMENEAWAEISQEAKDFVRALLTHN
jgi:calcium-dependent protein kinase